MSESIHSLSAEILRERYARGDLSPVEVTEAIIDRAQRLDNDINAFVVIDPEGARQQARAAAERWQRGEPASPLDGIPVSIKDLVAVSGFATRCGSRTVDPDTVSNEDSPVVARLREAGAVLIGKTHTPEFGWKGITDSPLHGITRNPWNLTRSAGGSSGGAGAALATGLGPLAHGTDAGGSIRIPASFCGLYGIKPTFGRVPHVPHDSPFTTLSTNGPLARTVRDAARMLTIQARPDDRDWLAAPYQAMDFETGLEDGVDGLRFAYSPRLGGVSPEPEVEERISEAVRQFEALGASVETVGALFDPLRPDFEAYWKAGFAYLLKSIPAEKHELMDPGLRVLAEEGRSVNLDAYYAGFAARAHLAQNMAQFHRRYDLLLTPTTPTTAPPADIVYHSAEYDRWEKAVPFTTPFNYTGQPAASIPVGLDSDGMPVGLQIVGPRYGEALILRTSYAFEQALPFPHRAEEA
jgi:aspartyl-tRNA(Asn)/glutamyl-tRNA(Gln) amidotransferase subunit A